MSRGLKSISQSRNDRPVASVTRSYPTFRCFLYHFLDAKGEHKLTLSCLHISSNFLSTLQLGSAAAITASNTRVMIRNGVSEMSNDLLSTF